jgi:endogenous inhibitor of DNA gyrase (YacG/DUF329 family)
MPYVVMVRCPNADKAVSTGIHCDIKDFCGLTDHLSLDCPECGQVHQWSVTDAWLRDAAWHESALRFRSIDALQCRAARPMGVRRRRPAF